MYGGNIHTKETCKKAIGVGEMLKGLTNITIRPLRLYNQSHWCLNQMERQRQRTITKVQTGKKLSKKVIGNNNVRISATRNLA